MRRNHGACLFLLLLLHAGFAQAAPANLIDPRHLQSLGTVEYLPFTPAALERKLHVFVDLPEGYLASDQRYPVVYLLDGGNTFPLLAAHHHYLRFGEEAPPMILVGISYGADRFQDGNLRQTDYTAPSPERAFWGGAENFLDVLARELLPMIEERYRADPRRRILFGHSLGGQFVLFTAMRRPGLFQGLIASNPAIIDNLAFFTDKQNLATREAGVTHLFLALSEFERDELAHNTTAWAGHWRGQDTPWVLEFRVLSGQTHLSSVPESFRQGVGWLLPSPAVEENAR